MVFSLYLNPVIVSAPVALKMMMRWEVFNIKHIEELIMNNEKFAEHFNMWEVYRDNEKTGGPREGLTHSEFIWELMQRYKHLSKLVEINEHYHASVHEQVEISPEVASLLWR
jgi:hypothetical protein